MRTVAIERCGGVEQLRMMEVPRPQPGPGEILVRVAYAGVNPADWKCREGWLAPYFQYRFPFVLGFDAAGVVARVGEGVIGFAVGDRIVACSKQGLGEGGSYAEYMLALAALAAPLPPGCGMAEAAALPTAGITAYEGVFESGRVQPGRRVLVHGGAGGVGSYAIQLARHAGARVAATCGPANLDYVRSLGAELAIDYRRGRIAEDLAAWAPQGVDLLLDAVGNGSLPRALELVRPGGVLAPVATLITDEPAHDADGAAQRGVRIVPTMSSYQRSGAQLRELVRLFGEGNLRAPALTVLPLAHAAEAHALAQAGHVRGKLLLEVAGDLQ